MSSVPPQMPITQRQQKVGTPRSIGVSILLAIVTLGIYTYVWTWKTHDEIEEYCGQGVGGAVGFILYFVFSPITFFLLPGELKKMLELDGQTSPVSPIIGLWILLPIIGNIIWFVKVQGTLNTFWTSKGAVAK